MNLNQSLESYVSMCKNKKAKRYLLCFLYCLLQLNIHVLLFYIAAPVKKCIHIFRKLYDMRADSTILRLTKNEL
jgi:hypothetical protein